MSNASATTTRPPMNASTPRARSPRRRHRQRRKSICCVLVDVSGSMRESYGMKVTEVETTYQRESTRFNEALDAVLAFVESKCGDDSSGALVAVCAFGLHSDCCVKTCDLVGLLRYCDQDTLETASEADVQRFASLLSQHGAPYCSSYIRNYLSVTQAQFLYRFYVQRGNNRALKRLVESLPLACKQGVCSFGVDLVASDDRKRAEVANQWRKACEVVLTRKREESQDDLARFGRIQLHSAEDAFHSLKTFDSENRERREAIEMALAPFPFGGTPMCEAMTKVTPLLFENEKNENITVTRCAVIISDGGSTDGDPIPQAQQWREGNIVVVGCYVSSEDCTTAKTLYCDDSAPTNAWPRGATTLFQMCRVVCTTHPAVITLKRKYGWVVPSSGECRLFLGGNHEGLVDEALSVAQNLEHEEFVLIREYDLSVRFRRVIDDKEVQDQRGRTCWAEACASAIAMANARVVGRLTVPFNQYFNSLRAKMIAEHGDGEARVYEMLRLWCSREYKLRMRPMDEIGARNVLNSGRVCVVRYDVTAEEREIFHSFFDLKPNGILGEDDFVAVQPVQDPMVRPANTVLFGHAALLVNHTPDSLILMNSWGTKWGGVADLQAEMDEENCGFFRVRNSEVLRNMRFYDVFWKESDLSDGERACYDGSVV